MSREHISRELVTCDFCHATIASTESRFVVEITPPPVKSLHSTMLPAITTYDYHSHCWLQTIKPELDRLNR